ncbi:MAG: methyl-accepting chemotaxis protein [Thiomicrospira sp.]
MSFFQQSSLNTKVISLAAVVGFVVSLAIGVMMYVSTVQPVKSNIEARLFYDMKTYVDAQIDLKVQSGIMGATAMTLQRDVMESLVVEDRETIAPLFAGVRDGFRTKSIFQNIATMIMTADGRIMMRSWDLENYGQNAANSPLVQRAMKEKYAFGALGIGARGVGVMAISPIINEGEFLGMISLIQGLASVAKDFKAQKSGDWVLLADRRYIKEKYDTMPIVDGNRVIGEQYLLANNNWFDKEAVDRLSRVFQAVDGEQNALYLAEGKVIIDLPAYDEEGLIFGRHIFMLDEQAYLAPITTAVNNAWLSLFGVLFGVFILTLALVWAIGRMVIAPLKKVQQVSDEIIRSGDFSIRAEVNSQDEVGKTASAINQLLENVSQALVEANDTVGAISVGDFSRRMQRSYVGDLARLKEGINHSADNITQVMKQLGRVMQSMRDGEFDIHMECKAKGDYLVMMNNAQEAMNELNGIIAQVNEVMGLMQKGQFGHRVEVEARGEMQLLKERINDSLSQLDRAMQDITRIVVAQSEGDLTQSITADYEGDLKTLQDAVNRSLEKLAQIVSQAVQASNIVNNAADEVSKGALDLSQRVQEQAAALEQTSATMDEMNSAVQNNTENAQQAAVLARKVQSDAEDGEQVMQQTILAMNAIQESSHKIAEIVSLIDGIAFQTNLLALNAAVEAARAGDHGRGFAVVAGEVRSLAQKSAEAAKDIKHLIDESVQRIDGGTKLASESGERLVEITRAIEQVTGMINQIAQASAEQAEGVSQVHTAISDIDGATQQNAALVEQTSAAAESMSEQATELNRNMAFFKTGMNQGASVAPKALASRSTATVKTVTAKTAAPKPKSSSASSAKDEWAEF